MKSLNRIQTISMTDVTYEFTYVINSTAKPPETTVTVANVPVKAIVDTGSSVNLLNQSTFAKIQQENPDIRLQISHTKVFPYGSNILLELIGEFKALMRMFLSRKSVECLTEK